MGGGNMVIKHIQEQLIEKTPLAFSFHEIIFNAQGLPIDYKLLQTNPAFESKLALSSSEVIGRKMSEWLLKTEQVREKWFDKFGDLVASEGRQEFEELLEFNGRSYLIAAFVPYPGYLIVLFRNITKLKKLEIALQEKNAALEHTHALGQSLFLNSPLAIIIYEVKDDGASSMDYIIQYVNPAALKIEDWHGKDVIGRPVKELRPGIDEFGIIEAFQKVWKTGLPTHYPAKIYREGHELRWFENIIFKLPSGEIVAVYEDITENKLAEEELFAQREKLSVTLYSIGDGVITTDGLGRVEMLNKVAEELMGWKQEEAIGKPLSSVFNIYNEKTGQPCENPVEKVLRDGKIVGLANHTILKARYGEVYFISDSAAPIKNQEDEILGVVLVFSDVTEAREREAKIEYLSYRDYLTGLYNRAFLEEAIKELDTEGKLPLTLIIGDFDGLKLINDVFGHQVGDQALIEMARIIKSCCRETDLISRWGGDEFLILLPETTEEMGQKICDRIREASHGVKVADANFTISLGCATKSNPKEKWEEIVKRAENKMYQSKLLGEKSYRSTILNSFKNALFEKSCETEEHGERLGYFCREIGEIMGLSSFEIDELEVFAMLHDIGKIAIDDTILLKPSKLTGEEWEIMQKHPEIGYRIARAVPELLHIADYILSHHERWDGKGYPRGLVGEEIPLSARILAVVDAYDAMTHDRPYRRALSEQEAREELKINSGTQFDPQIVDIFLTYLEKG